MREFVQVPSGFRSMLEELADLAILLLDELDGDVDLEETGDLEPWLGSYVVGLDLELDEGEDEPSLGSLDRAIDQTRWAENAGGLNACHDLERDDCDREPSLGSLGDIDQTTWASGDRLDREPNGDEADGPDDNGIADDGLAERINPLIGNDVFFLPTDTQAVRDARLRLSAIMDRIGGSRR